MVKITFLHMSIPNEKAVYEQSIDEALHGIPEIESLEVANRIKRLKICIAEAIVGIKSLEAVDRNPNPKLSDRVYWNPLDTQMDLLEVQSNLMAYIATESSMLEPELAQPFTNVQALLHQWKEKALLSESNGNILSFKKTQAA